MHAMLQRSTSGVHPAHQNAACPPGIRPQRGARPGTCRLARFLH